MRRRIAVLGAMLLALVGIVVIAPESGALNSEGIHTVSFACNSGAHHSTTSFTYNLTFLNITNDAGGHPYRWNYAFQMLSSTFQGTTPPSNRGPTLGITTAGMGTPNGNGYISAGYGGDINVTSNYVWPHYMAHNTTVGGPRTITNDVTPLDVGSTQPGGGTVLHWTPRSISIVPSIEGNSWARFNVYQIGCDQYVDLGLPDAPAAGNRYVGATCNDTVWLKVNYTVNQVDADTFSVHVQNAELRNDPATGVSGITTLQLNVSGITGGNQIADSGTSNWLNPPSSFSEVDGLNGVNFPTVTFDYQPGQTVNFNAVVLRSSDQDCSTHQNLSLNWDPAFTGSYPAFEDTSFDDCSSNPTVFKVKPLWQKTTDGAYYRLTSLQIFQSNSSGSTIVLDAGTATILGGVTVAENASPLSNLVTINSLVSLADRTITSGEWQTFPVATNNKWTRVSASASHSSAPASFYTLANRYPTVTIRGKVYNSIGAQCVPSNPGGTGDISELDFQPVSLL
jgi:hypothetical protein